jgi:hypothetical protein
MTWADLFDRADAYATTVDRVRETLAVRRDGTAEGDPGERA